MSRMLLVFFCVVYVGFLIACGGGFQQQQSTPEDDYFDTMAKQGRAAVQPFLANAGYPELGKDVIAGEPKWRVVDGTTHRVQGSCRSLEGKAVKFSAEFIVSEFETDTDWELNLLIVDGELIYSADDEKSSK